MSYIEDNAPGLDDYILYVGKQEAVEQTNPDDASATEPVDEKIELAIELAKSEVLATFCVACPAGKLFLAKLSLPLILDITRYRLDTIKRREDIKEAYEKACKLLERATSDEICKMEVSAADSETFGIPFCPGVSFSAAPRVWTRESLRCFREQRHVTGSSRSKGNRFTTRK